MDERLKLLSYSSLLTLHSCPRKFQLYRLNVTQDERDVEADVNKNITFAFGHIVGEGIQNVLAGMTEEQVLLNAFLSWYVDLEHRDTRLNKSFYSAVNAIQRFVFLAAHGFLEDYELVQFNGKPAIELSFRITMPNGFKLRGSVDAVLRHKVSGEVLVLECKTTSSTSLNAASYKNSSQAIGYSVVLDVLFKDISSYKVLYLIYQTKDMSYEQMPFIKTYLQRAQWIQELIHDTEIISMYESSGVYPMRGESCYSFNRSCEYFSTCTLSTKYLVKELPKDSSVDGKSYDIELTLEDLISGQLDRTAEESVDSESVDESCIPVPLLPGDILL